MLKESSEMLKNVDARQADITMAFIREDGL